jgi:hypothetical protein
VGRRRRTEEGLVGSISAGSVSTLIQSNHLWLSDLK